MIGLVRSTYLVSLDPQILQCCNSRLLSTRTEVRSPFDRGACGTNQMIPLSLTDPPPPSHRPHFFSTWSCGVILTTSEDTASSGTTPGTYLHYTPGRRCGFVPKLEHFGNHFLPIMAHFDVSIKLKLAETEIQDN